MPSSVKHRRRLAILVIGLAAAVIVAVTLVIVPVYQSLLAKSQLETCISRAQSIATLQMTYAHTWSGWTHPDPDYYVKTAGYRLSSEAGYDLGAAARVTQFCCPADPSPRRNRHGIPSSYRVSPIFTGSSIMRPHEPLWFVYERGKRHLHEGRLEAVYVFDSGRVQLGYDRLFPGVEVAIWQLRPGVWDTAKRGDPVPLPECEHDLNLCDFQWLSIPFDWVEQWVRQSSGPSGKLDKVDALVLRFEGLISFREGGVRALRVERGRGLYLWMDENRNGLADATEVSECGRDSVLEATVHRLTNIEAKEKYRFRFVCIRQRGDEGTEIWWIGPDERKRDLAVDLYHTLN